MIGTDGEGVEDGEDLAGVFVPDAVVRWHVPDGGGGAG